jgi:hypothetical protein
MDKETHKKLTKNFPKDMVKPAPKGKFGSYIPHHLYTQRLVDVVGGKYNFFVKEVLRDKDNAVVGAICRLEIEGLGAVEEVGDVDVHQVARNITESEILKLAVSDGIKRCCMRFGIGLELWTGGETEEEHYAGRTEETPKKKQVAQESGISPSKEDDEEDLAAIILDMCMQDKLVATRVWDYCVKRMETKPGIPKIVTEYESSHKKTFIEEAAKHYKAIMKDAKEREGNPKIVNETIDAGLETEVIKESNTEDVLVVGEKEEEDMADIPDGPWKQKPISEAQIDFIEKLIKQAIDKKQDALAAEAKQYLSSGEATQGNASAIIDKLKDALS